MEALKETEEWSTQWAGKLYCLIFKHDMATKEAASKARAQTMRACKAANFGSVFINATPDTYLNSKGSRMTHKKIKSN